MAATVAPIVAAHVDEQYVYLGWGGGWADLLNCITYITTAAGAMSPTLPALPSNHPGINEASLRSRASVGMRICVG
jgi:hypothetical protein